MLICPNCKLEMSCIKNGVKVIYSGGFHVYPGDKYKCKGCDAEVILTNHQAYNPEIPVVATGHDVVMS